jgi:hypothetical protein
MTDVREEMREDRGIRIPAVVMHRFPERTELTPVREPLKQKETVSNLTEHLFIHSNNPIQVVTDPEEIANLSFLMIPGGADLLSREDLFRHDRVE